MKTELKDRVLECRNERGISNADLARAAQVAQPTAYHWASGKTKEIKGPQLLRAARALNVNAEWLATGLGPKRPAQMVSEPAPAYTDRERAQAAFDLLPDAAMPELIRQMELLSLAYKKKQPSGGPGFAVSKGARRAAYAGRLASRADGDADCGLSDVGAAAWALLGLVDHPRMAQAALLVSDA